MTPFIAILVWTASLSATSYTLSYGPSSGEYRQSLVVAGTNATIQYPDGVDFYGAVTASNDSGTSAPSDELHISGQSAVAVPGGLVISANSGRATLEVSNDLITWATASTFSGMQGPTFYPLTKPEYFYRLK